MVVTNDGARTVQLDRLVASYMGPSGGSVLRTDPQPPVSEEQRRLGDDTDARYWLDRDLQAGRTYRTEITLGFREQGCSHGRSTLSGCPTLEVKVLGRGPIEVRADDDLVFIRQGPSTECRTP